MDKQQKKDFIRYASALWNERRRERAQEIVRHRTRWATMVLEDIYQSHNISAAIRSAECFGLQDVHIIEQTNRFSVNINITKGASEWMDLYRYRDPERSNVADCYAELKKRGYQIIATSPHPKGYILSEMPVDKPFALVFGTEETGLSSYALEHADAYVRIPMYGFTESFNISVSAALCLMDATERMRALQVPWQLSDEEQDDIMLAWLRRTIRGIDELEQRFLDIDSI